MPTVVYSAAQPVKRRDDAYSRRQRRALIMLPLLIILLFIAFGFGVNLIPSESMLPTLKPGDHTLTMRAWLAYPFGRMPARGDIILFKLDPSQAETIDMSETEALASESGIKGKASKAVQTLQGLRGEIFIKRVIALPGEKVLIQGNDVLINGQKLREDYQTMQDDGNYSTDYPYAGTEPLTVPEGELFVLGDNRGSSDDSRNWGTLRRSAVVGKFVRVLYNKPLEKPVENAPTWRRRRNSN